MSWNYGRKCSIWKPFPSNPQKPKHTGFLGSACCFMFLCVPIPPVLNTFKKAVSLTARPADWWAMLNQIDFEQNIVHSCYGKSSDDFCWFRSCWTFVCTWVPGKRHALREDSRSWRLHQLQWSNECSKYTGFHVPRKMLHWKKTFANQLLIGFDSMIDSTDAPRPNIEACSSAPLLESSAIYWRVATWRMVEWTSWEGVDGLRQNVVSLHEDVKQSIMIQTYGSIHWILESCNLIWNSRL